METFLRWFCITLTYSVMTFFGYYLGIFQNIWHVDFSYMTSVIAAVFTSTVGYLGYASWKLHHGKNGEIARLLRATADVGVGRNAAYIVTLLGLLGTAIGLMTQVQAIGHLDVSQVSNISSFVSSIGSSLGTALYATCSGIVASIGISVLCANIEHYLDMKSASR